MSDFFRNLADEVKDIDSSILADGEGAAEFTGYIQTGHDIIVIDRVDSHAVIALILQYAFINQLRNKSDGTHFLYQ